MFSEFDQTDIYMKSLNTFANIQVFASSKPLLKTGRFNS